MADFDIEQAKKDVGRWYWHGIPTFFRCEWNEDPAAADIALIGVPHSAGNGSTERDQHLGPRAVRNISALYRRSHGRFGITPWDLVTINDAGDTPLPEAMNNDVSVGHIEAYAAQFEKTGTRVVAMGGDHAITGPLVKACAGAHSSLTVGQKVALVHFDSHTDTLMHLPHWLGNKRSAAHWGAYLVEEGHVDASKSTQVGIRPNVGTAGSLNTSDALGYRVVGMDEVEEIGWKGVVEILRERIGDAPVYITFDLDSLDPCDAPGASNLEPGYPGIRIGEAVRMLQGLRGLNVVGGDVVCLIPTKDNPNKITAQNAMVVMFEMLSLMADYIHTNR
ncbi:arginase family protein [Pseudogemmobacter bohemicus]|uniref:arginase family protein n=1 Tax=Pseudogemmobacter bohemicus TaxID=2250708 RepID=UPI000DD44267|nr:arginase family protein [Pseudogemmobacter bohemicus]